MSSTATTGRDARTQTLHEMERYALAHADSVIWQGGDILGTYQRFYGRAALAAPVRIRYPYAGPTTDAASDAGLPSTDRCGSSTPGASSGARECRTSSCRDRPGRDDVSLTLVGDDTDTAR